MSTPFKMKGPSGFKNSPTKNRMRPKTEPVNPSNLSKNTNTTPRQQRGPKRERGIGNVERLSRLNRL